MERNWLKVFIACALGALIGSMVALEINGYLYWLGLIVGGFVGYISYEFKAVLEAIPEAWRRATSWRPNTRYWKAYGALLAYHGLSLLGLATIFVAILVVIVGFMPPSDTSSLAWFIGLLALPVITALGGAVLFSYDEVDYILEGKRAMPELKGDMLKFALKYNAVTFFFWHIPRWTLLGIWWLIIRIPDGLRAVRRAAMTFGRFLWNLVVLVHSDVRLLCGVDAAIGAGLGYFAGNALIGAVGGGIFGVLNYEIVSKRVLHLVPEKNHS